MVDILQFEFMRNALWAALLVSIACGIVGTYVVVKRIVFISGGISHSAFGGIGLGYLLGINPILAAIPFTLLSALIMGTIAKKIKISEDTAIGILWTVGMALGIIFINLSPGYAPDLFSYLFGSILTVPASDLIVMAGLDAVIIFFVAVFFKEFSAMSFDEEYSTIIGIPTHVLYILLLCLVALSVVVLIRVVGVILVIALLTIPAAISRFFTDNIRNMIILSIILGGVLTTGGILLSYMFNLASGATIILLLGAVFIIASLFKRRKPA
ncbi:MAG: metal ABC transporter permease [Chloroflexi bacterium]|nr:metal ABC transporter permease [Chloroflexota bacterium]